MRSPFSICIGFAVGLGCCVMTSGCSTRPATHSAPAPRIVTPIVPVVDAPGERLIDAIIGPNRDPGRAVALVRDAPDVNKGRPNCPPLYAATCLPDMLGVVKALVARGANLDRRGTHGYTALHNACAHANPAAAEFLINSGADIEARALGGLTPLHASVMGEIWHNSTAACAVLLAHGADVNARDENGWTPLDHALKHYTTRTEGDSVRFAGARSAIVQLLKRHDRATAAAAPG